MKEENFVESVEQSVTERLDSLGVNYECTKDDNGKLIYRFFNVNGLEGGAFSLDAQGKSVVFQSFHFDDGKFKNPIDKSEITPNELLEMIKEKFPDADEFVYSCCNPDGARSLFHDDSRIILGSGSSEYKTVHNSFSNVITVSSK